MNNYCHYFLIFPTITDMNEKPYTHRSPVLNAMIQVSMAAAYINQQIDIAIVDLGITNVQYNVLRILKRHAPEGIARIDIMRQLVEQSVDLTRSINNLVNLGYVVRMRPENDRRLVLHHITEEGSAALSKIDPLLHKMLSEIEGKLTVEEWLQISELCVKMRA